MELTRRAETDLRRFSRTDRDRIDSALEDLRHGRGDVRPLRGQSGVWRLRVGDWRLLFVRNLQTRVIEVLAVRPRGGAYRG